MPPAPLLPPPPTQKKKKKQTRRRPGRRLWPGYATEPHYQSTVTGLFFIISSSSGRQGLHCTLDFCLWGYHLTKSLLLRVFSNTYLQPWITKLAFVSTLACSSNSSYLFHDLWPQPLHTLHTPLCCPHWHAQVGSCWALCNQQTTAELCPEWTQAHWMWASSSAGSAYQHLCMIEYLYTRYIEV